ncbi:hypothetical protein PZA11_003428 [Diplocarpon coronariae]
MWSPKPSWQSLARAHREAAASRIPSDWRLPLEVTDPVSQASGQSVMAIPSTCGLLTPEQIDITENYSAVTLLKHLASGRFTSVTVTTAFCKRAAIAQQLVSCLTEIFFEEALERAKYCDDYLAREGKTLGPFHGIPISLKDSFNIKGQKSTIGYTSFISNPPATSNSPLVTILLSLGCVLYVKTNVPQTMMTADSHNNIFGRVLNPRNTALTAGGSSGGEGALSALRGSILGVGTDIAGSIRIPAFCNGVVGFKPSTRRIPYSGQTSPGRAGNFGILESAGPICRDVADAELFMRSVLSYDCWKLDADVLPLPWRQIRVPAEGEEERILRIGLLLEDPRFPLHPPMQRVLQTVVSILEKAGHVVVSLSPLLPETLSADALHTAMRVLSSDPNHTAIRNIKVSHEPLIPSIATTITPEMAEYAPTLDSVFEQNVRMKGIKDTVRDVWVKEDLDAVVMPVFQGMTPGHDKFGGPSYTVLANLLDYPACAIPFGKAEKEVDEGFVRDMTYVPPYDADAVEGVLGGFQVMGRNLKDEETLEVTRIVFELLKKAEGLIDHN